MARSQGTILNDKDAYAALSFAPTVDLRIGGQNGYVPDYRTFISNSAYVRQNVIPFLVEYPRGFEHLPNTEIWIGTLKALIEQQAKTIEGLNGTISVSYIENPIGQSGEQQEDVSQVQRARSTPSFTWVEKQGRPVHLFFNGWIFYLIGHPDTQVPALVSLEMNRNKRFDYLPDFNSMSVLFIEPDRFHQRVVEAWFCVNMMPKGSGDLNGGREIGGAGQGRDVNIEFTCMTLMSMGVLQFAQSVLDELNYIGLNPQTRRSSVEEISAAIRDVQDGNKSNIGYSHQVDEIATNQHYMSGENDLSSKVVHNPDWVLQHGDRQNQNLK